MSAISALLTLQKRNKEVRQWQQQESATGSFILSFFIFDESRFCSNLSSWSHGIQIKLNFKTFFFDFWDSLTKSEGSYNVGVVTTG